MLRSALAITLCVLMVLPAQGSQQVSLTVQEQIAHIPTGSIVEVKTKLKNMKKVRGRLGTVTKEGLEVQVARGQAIDNVKLNFVDVKSIAEKSQQNRPHATVYILAGVGIALAVLLVVGIVLSRTVGS